METNVFPHCRHSSTNYLHLIQMRQRLSFYNGADKPIQEMLKQKKKKLIIFVKHFFIYFYVGPYYDKLGGTNECLPRQKNDAMGAHIVEYL